MPKDEYDNLIKENFELKNKILTLYSNEKQLNEIIISRDKTIEELKKENLELKNRIVELENEIKIIKNDKEKLDTLIKLNDCNALVNKHFKLEYKNKFKPKRNEYIPNIGDIINDPPNELDDKEYYDFWMYFKNKYPGSDDKRFRNIYSRISSDRVYYGAHVDISHITKEEFDKLMSIGIPDIYNSNKPLCVEYRDWLFKFPQI
jgi:hypothetical protein